MIAPLRESRLPVGSSASSTGPDGFVRQRAGNGEFAAFRRQKVRRDAHRRAQSHPTRSRCRTHPRLVRNPSSHAVRIATAVPHFPPPSRWAARKEKFEKWCRCRPAWLHFGQTVGIERLQTNIARTGCCRNRAGSRRAGDNLTKSGFAAARMRLPVNASCSPAMSFRGDTPLQYHLSGIRFYDITGREHWRSRSLDRDVFGTLCLHRNLLMAAT